jgi:flagellar hook-length control protein FliK
MLDVHINAAEAPTAPKAHSTQHGNSPSSQSPEKSFKSVLEKELPQEQQTTTDTSKETAAEVQNADNTNSTDEILVAEQTGQSSGITGQEQSALIDTTVGETALVEAATNLIAAAETSAPIVVNLTADGEKKKADITSGLTGSTFKAVDTVGQSVATGGDAILDNDTGSFTEVQKNPSVSNATVQTENLTVSSDTQQKLTPQQEALLLRIQKLIENGDVGTVTIKKSALSSESASLRQQLALLSSVQVQEVDESQTQFARIVVNGSGFTELEDGVFGQTLRTRQQYLSGLRQDATHQFYDAKTQPQNSSNDSTNLGSNQQGGEMAQQGSGFNQTAVPGSQTEQVSTFSLPTSSTLDATSTQAVDSTRTTILPSGTVVHDHEVIQQMVERFQINRRAMDSKIQMRLHPAELGEMEIDLTVKEGSIRANVVAQSQHVQEILERNLNRLKTVLEQQGFSIEEISVTTESDMVGEFDLFDQQLPNRDQNNSAANAQTIEPLSPFIIEELEGDYLGSPTGVNVKA